MRKVLLSLLEGSSIKLCKQLVGEVHHVWLQSRTAAWITISRTGSRMFCCHWNVGVFLLSFTRWTS